jgi:hypothetical protein
MRLQKNPRFIIFSALHLEFLVILIHLMQPLDDIEQMELQNEILTRQMDQLGSSRLAAYYRTKAQAEAMRRRHNFGENPSDYYYEIRDTVKMKHYQGNKPEFNWKGPYHIVDLGFPGTYWLMTPDGLRLDATVNESSLAPWLQPVRPNEDFFYDGYARRTNFERGDIVTSNASQSQTPIQQ